MFNCLKISGLALGGALTKLSGDEAELLKVEGMVPALGRRVVPMEEVEETEEGPGWCSRVLRGESGLGKLERLPLR